MSPEHVKTMVEAADQFMQYWDSHGDPRDLAVYVRELAEELGQAVAYAQVQARNFGEANARVEQLEAQLKPEVRLHGQVSDRLEQAEALIQRVADSYDGNGSIFSVALEAKEFVGDG